MDHAQDLHTEIKTNRKKYIIITKMASYNVNALPDYVEQNRPELIQKAVMSAKSADLFNLITGVHGPTALNLIDSEVVFGDGSTCGWNNAGETSLSQAILTPRALKVNMSICDKNLLRTWAGYLVKVQANKLDSDLPFEEYFLDSVLKEVKAKVETMLYQGDSSNQNAVEFDGLLTILGQQNEETSEYIYEPVQVTAGTSAYNFLKSVALQIPGAVLEKDDCVILVSTALYNEYMQDLVTANLFHYDPANGENEYKLPGTSIRVIAVAGLNTTDGNDYVIAGSLSNIFYGVNMEDGDEVFDLWYSKDNREFRLAIEFIAGVQVAYPDEIKWGIRPGE